MKTALIVEDQENYAKSLERMVRIKNPATQVLIAKTRDEAFSYIDNTERIDVASIDGYFPSREGERPELNGNSVAEYLRKYHCRAKIIGLSTDAKMLNPDYFDVILSKGAIDVRKYIMELMEE